MSFAFLETITTLGDNVLIPINRIKCIFVTFVSENHPVIKIVTDHDEYQEHFFDLDACNRRYDEIKSIIKGA